MSCFSSVKCFTLCVVSPVSLCSHSPRQVFHTFFPPQTSLSSPCTHLTSFSVTKEEPRPRTASLPHHAYTPLCSCPEFSFSPVLLNGWPVPPLVLPTITLPLLGTVHFMTSHLIRKYFPIFLLPLSRHFPISVQHASVQCCPVRLSVLMGSALCLHSPVCLPPATRGCWALGNVAAVAEDLNF